MTKRVALKAMTKKRYVATCPKCGKTFDRAKRESAEHSLQIHLNYEMCQ